MSRKRRYACDWASEPFCVFRHDPIEMRLQTAGVGSIAVFLGLLVITLGVKILIAAISGTLISPSLANDLAMDSANLPFLSLPAQGVRLMLTAFPSAVGEWMWSVLLSVAGGTYGEQTGSGVHVIPYARDYADPLLMILISLNLAFIHRHWRLISHAPTAMMKTGVLNSNVVKYKTFTAICKTADRRVNSRGSTVAIAAAAVTLIVVAYGVVIPRWGMYPLLQPGGHALGAWEKEAYAGWWAHPSRDVVGYVYQMLMMLAGAYYILRHNWVGVVSLLMLRALFKLDKGASEDESTFKLIAYHSDGYAGLKPLQSIIVMVFLNVLVGSLIILTLLLYVPTGAAFLLLIYVFLLFALNPLFVILPLRAIHSEVQAQKDERAEELNRYLQRLSKDLMDSKASYTDAELKLMEMRYKIKRDELTQLLNVPTHLFSFSRVLAFSAVYLIPIALAIWQLAGL